MAERNLNGKIIQILYTTEELSQEPLCDIIIDKGIVVYEKCENGKIKMKMGNGVNIWSELDYIGKESEINDELISSETTYSSTKIEDLINETSTTINNAITTKADIDYVENLYKTLNSNTTLGFYCIEDVTIVTNGISKVYSANSNVEVTFTKDDVFEIIPTSDKSILKLNAFPNALGTYYSWLEGVKQFSNILFDMNAEDMYSKWSQGNQGAYQVQFAQYINCIFWSDKSYISDVSKRTNYTLYYSSQLPLCYSTIPDNTFKSFYLAFNVNSDPNWGNEAYRDSFAKATWATQAFSYYGARTIGIFGHDDPDFNITLPKDCRGLMYQSTAIENAGTFDAVNTTNFGAKSGSWREAFGQCSSLRNLYIKNLKVNLNISWSPINYDSIYFIISTAANTNKITISVSPYTYNLLSQSDFELAASKNITIALLTGNYVEDRRLSDIANKADKTDILNLQDEIDSIKGITDEKLAESKTYTDTKVANLVGTAPETLDTLEEVSKAIKDNEDVVSTLNSAIGNKANQSDLNDLNNKINNIKTVEINDEEISTTSTYSSGKIEELLDNIDILEMDDENISTNTVYSSSKVEELLDNNKISAIDTNNEIFDINSLNISKAMTSWNELEELPIELNKSSVVLFNDKIHVLGSSYVLRCNKNHYSMSDDMLNKLEDLPYKHDSACAVVYNNEIHIFGGNDSPYQQYHYKFNGTEWIQLEDLPFEFFSGCAVIYNNEIHALGGHDSSSDYYKSHYQFDGTTWIKLDDLPYEFYDGKAVVYNNEIHLLGSNRTSSNRYHYKWDGTTWTQLEDLPYEFYNGSVVVYNDEIHIMGGFNISYRKYHYKWDGTSWVKLKNLPYEFYYCSAVVYNDEIRILGGRNNEKLYYKFNNTDDVWTKLNDLPYEFYNGSAVVYNDEIHLFGSDFYEYKYTKSHYEYDGSTWTQLEDLPYEFYNGSAIVYENEIHILGSNYSSCKKNHYKYNGVSWTIVSTLPYNFYNGSAIIYNNEIHILGDDGINGYKSHYKFNINNSTWTQVSILPNEFFGSYAIIYDDAIHLLGGGMSSSNYKYHHIWNGIEWTRLDDLPYNFTNSLAIVHNNKINLIGCSYNSSNCKSHYELNDTTWTKLDNLPYDIDNSSSVVVYNNDLHLLGGSNENYNKDHCVLTTSNDELISVTIDDNITIPFVNINDKFTSTTSTYSSTKIKNLINSSMSNITSVGIDDITSSVDTTYSSNKINSLIAETKEYTDDKVADLVGTAPETLNTLEEVAKAIEDNEDVVEALNGAIGNKANQSDLNDLNNKINNIKTVEINDEEISTDSVYSSNKINTLMENTPTAGLKLTETLSAGQTTLTFTDSQITTSSKLDAVYTSKFGIRLKSAEFNNGNIVLEFLPQNEDIDVMIVLNASLPPNDNNNNEDGSNSNVKSAYEFAQEDGYEGTEEEFNEVIGSLTNVRNEITEELNDVRNDIAEDLTNVRNETTESLDNIRNDIKTPYDYAKDGGYEGTEEEFISAVIDINNKLTSGDVVNNLTSTSTTLPLSAYQGKVLSDRISNIGSSTWTLVLNNETNKLVDLSRYTEIRICATGGAENSVCPYTISSDFLIDEILAQEEPFCNIAGYYRHAEDFSSAFVDLYPTRSKSQFGVGYIDARFGGEFDSDATFRVYAR